MNSPWSTLNIICFHVHFSKLSTLPYFAICIHLRFSTATCTGKVQISLLATAHDLASWPFAVYRRVPTVPLLPSVPSHPSFHGAHFFSNVGGLARLLKICVHRREGAAGIALALLLKLEGVGSIFTIVTLVSNNPKRDILTRRLAALQSRVLGKMWNGTEHMDLSDEKVHQNLMVYIGSSSKWSSPWYHQFLDTSYRQFFHYSDSFQRHCLVHKNGVFHGVFYGSLSAPSRLGLFRLLGPDLSLPSTSRFRAKFCHRNFFINFFFLK